MTYRPSDRLRLFLAAVIAALAAILLGTTASASAAVGAETRVGAISHIGEVLVGLPKHESPGQRLGEAAPQPDFVVATGVAANAASGARLAEDLSAAQLANPLVDSLRATGGLPSNYVTKSQAAAAGWSPGKALDNHVPGGQLGGDVFKNPAGIGLPTAPGRTWFEADIGLSGFMSRAKQRGTRLLYFNDGMAYVTPDHYGRLYQLPGW